MHPIHHILRIGMLLGLLSLAAACNAAEKPRTPMNNNDPMITHYIGRFMIQVPQSMKIARRSAQLRFRELEEITWLGNTKVIAESTWKTRLVEIEEKPSPKGKQKTLIEVRDLGNEIRAALYYGDPNDDERVFWDILLNTKYVGVWIKWKGLERSKEKMLGFSLDIARAYHPLAPTAPPPKENAFYLEHGYIALPYLEQEEAYARFEGHSLGLKLRVQTNETHEDESQDEGLLGRLTAVLATGFAAGVDIEKIRTGKREVGGLKGEETVLRAKAKDKIDLSFLWRYAGKKDSGDYPEIVIEIEAKDGQLDEKLKVWDALLNSFKPVGR